MPLVHECTEPGCNTLTMGPLCLAHELGTAPPTLQRAAPRRRSTAFAAAVLAGLFAAFLARARLV